MTSQAREERGSVTIEIVGGAERMKVFQDIDQAVSRIRTFPDEIDQPEVSLQTRQVEVMRVGLYGPVDTWTLRQIAERTRDQLLREPIHHTDRALTRTRLCDAHRDPASASA